MASKPKASAAPQVNGFGEPSSKLQELFAKTVTPQPYPVSDKIVIQPLTKKSRQRLDELQNQRMAGNYLLAAALGGQGASDKDLEELTKVIKDADDEYNRVFFGDQLDNVLEFFADRPTAHWEAFCRDIRRQFYAEPGPDTGRCPKCGDVTDAEQVGKDGAPST